MDQTTGSTDRSEGLASNTKLSPPDTRAWWKNRRIQAYIAIAGLYTILYAVTRMSTEHLTAAMPILEVLTYVFAGVLYMYSGGATMEDIVKLRNFK